MTATYDCAPWHAVLKLNPDLFAAETDPFYTQLEGETVTYGTCRICHSTIGLRLDRQPLTAEVAL